MFAGNEKRANLILSHFVHQVSIDLWYCEKATKEDVSVSLVQDRMGVMRKQKKLESNTIRCGEKEFGSNFKRSIYIFFVFMSGRWKIKVNLIRYMRRRTAGEIPTQFAKRYICFIQIPLVWSPAASCEFWIRVYLSITTHQITTMWLYETHRIWLFVKLVLTKHNWLLQ